METFIRRIVKAKTGLVAIIKQGERYLSGVCEIAEGVNVILHRSGMGLVEVKDGIIKIKSFTPTEKNRPHPVIPKAK